MTDPARKIARPSAAEAAPRAKAPTAGRAGAAGPARKAARLYKQTLRRDPDNGDALMGLAMIAQGAGRYEHAARLFARARDVLPDHAGCRHGLGMALRALGRAEEAVDCFRQALALEPAAPATLSALGNALKSLGRFEEAVACLWQTVEMAPDSALDWSNLGVAYKAWGRSREAVDCLSRAVAIAPAQPELHYNLGNAFLAADLFEEARRSFDSCLALAPAHFRARTNLGIAFKEQGLLDRARACFSDVVAQEPTFADAHWNRALARLAAGDYAAGWAGYEWRRMLPGFPVRKLALPEWDGGGLEGRTLLVHSEQGLGDTIQFCRYASLVRRRRLGPAGGAVVLEVPEALVPLLSGLAGVDAVRAARSGAEDGGADMQAPLMSLPGLIAPDPAETRDDIPYLRAEADLVELWGERLRPHAGLRVGLCWQGNPSYAADRRRSLAPRHLGPLARLDGVRLVSLQKPAEDGAGLPTRDLSLVDPGPEFDSAKGAFMDAAAIIAHLDLVVTSDTAIAHLAGALGAEVWVMLAKVPDWRWGLAGETTPWYPNMRLFRQPTAGDWTAVIERIAAELRERRQ